MFANTVLRQKGASNMKKRYWILSFLLLILIVWNIVIPKEVTASGATGENRYYTAVQVKEGDSLWKIAETWCGDPDEIQDYVDELREINHIVNEFALEQGSYITVYYYGK